jgi:hypothetical protein
MFLLLFSRRCIQLECEEIEKTSCGGSLPKKVCSRSSHSFVPWPVLEIVAFPEKVCGQAPSRAVFLAWSTVRFSPWIISESSMLS